MTLQVLTQIYPTKCLSVCNKSSLRRTKLTSLLKCYRQMLNLVILRKLHIKIDHFVRIFASLVDRRHLMNLEMNLKWVRKLTLGCGGSNLSWMELAPISNNSSELYPNNKMIRFSNKEFNVRNKISQQH